MNQNKEKIRIGIIGCGTHAIRGHFAPFAAMSDMFDVAAAMDPDRTALGTISDAITGKNFSFFTDEDRFFSHAKTQLDAVVIASPDRFHFAQVAKAVDAGLHVLVEKPIITALEQIAEFRDMLLIAGKRQVIVTSCHPRRFDEINHAIKNDIAMLTAVHGKIIALDFDFSYHEPSAGKRGLHSGLLADHLNHEFDLSTFLLGPSITTMTKLHDGEDAYAAAGIRHADAIALNFRGTRRLKTRKYPEFLRIRFERAEQTVHYLDGGATVFDHETGAMTDIAYPPVDYVARFERLAHHFGRTMIGEVKPYLTTNDLIRNNAVCAALTHGTTWTG